MPLFQLQLFFRRSTITTVLYFLCWCGVFFWYQSSYFHEQRLNAGDDPCTAFLLSSEAAVAGAESTKHMQAQVTFLFLFFSRFLLRVSSPISCLIQRSLCKLTLIKHGSDNAWWFHGKKNRLVMISTNSLSPYRK